MDIRQVALGAAFGAAVAVNAALQSLQDAGSFLIHSPGSRKRPLDLLGATRKRAPSFVDEEDDEEDFLDFRDGDDDELAVSNLEDEDGRMSPGASHQESSQPDGPDGAECLKARDEPTSSTQNGDGDLELELEPSTASGNCSKRRKVQGPSVFLPLLPPMAQTEEAMALMLQHTTDTVLNTLADAKGRRERMINQMRRVHLPEKESSLKLVNSFIDALVNVSDSLKIVQSALFVRKDGTP